MIITHGWRFSVGSAATAATLLLSGCAGGELSPLGSSLQGVVPGLASGPAPAERAADIPYASLLLDVRERSGLIVQGAASGGHTLWPTGQQGAISLYQDGLAATAGFSEDLLSLNYSPRDAASPTTEAGAALPPWQQDTPIRYTLESTWQTASGEIRFSRGQAVLTCADAEPHPLPLGERSLQHCQESVSWESGTRSVSHYYRSPEDRRLWAADVLAWPGASRIRWEVARAWW